MQGSEIDILNRGFASLGQFLNPGQCSRTQETIQQISTPLGNGGDFSLRTSVEPVHERPVQKGAGDDRPRFCPVAQRPATRHSGANAKQHLGQVVQSSLTVALQNLHKFKVFENVERD